MPELAQLQVILSGDDTQLNRTLDSAGKGIDKFGKQSEQKVNQAGKSFDSLGSKAAKAGDVAGNAAAQVASDFMKLTRPVITAGFSFDNFGVKASKALEEAAADAVKVAAESLKMGNAMQSASMAAAEQVEQLRKQVSGLEQDLKSSQEELRKTVSDFDKKVSEIGTDSARNITKAGDAFRGFGDKASEAGRAMAPASLAAASMLGLGVKVAAEYQQMGNVFQSVSSASVADMEKVRQKAVELGSDLALPGTSAKDAMAAMVELSKAGLSVADTMAAARGSIMLAAADGLQNARAAEIQANAMNSFALRGTEAMRVADLFAKAANASSAGVEDLAQAFAMGSSTAFAAKLSIEEYTAGLVAMANAGIKGSDAGTSVKTMLMSLMAPSDEATKAMSRIGLSYFDAAGKARPFTDVVKDLREQLAGMSEQEQADIMKTIFGTDGIRAAQIITRLGSDFDELVKQMEAAKDSATNMAASKNKGLLGALDALDGSVQTLMVAEGDKGLPGLERTIRKIAESVTKLGDLPDPMKDLLVGVTAVTAAAAPALIAIGSLSTGIGTLVSSYQAMAAALGVGGATAGGASATAATAGLASSLAVLAGVTVSVAAVAAGAAIAIKNDWGGAGEAFEDLRVSVQRDLSLLMDSFREFDQAHGEMIRGVIKDTTEAFGVVVAYSLDDFRRRLSVASDAVRAFTGVFSNAISVAKEVTGGFVLASANNFQLLGELAAVAFENIKVGAFTMAAGVVDAFRSMFSMFSPIAGALADKLGLADLSKMLKGLSEGAKQAAKDIRNNMNQRLFDSTYALAEVAVKAQNLINESRVSLSESDSESATGGSGNRKKEGTGTGNGRPPRMTGSLRPSLGEDAPIDPFGDLQAGIQTLSGEKLSKEAVKALEKVRLAALEAAKALNESFRKALVDLQAKVSEGRFSLKIEGLSEKDQLAMKNFGKMFDDLADPEKKKAIEELLHTTRLLESSANSTGKTGNPFFWADVSLPIIQQINQSHREYMDNLAHELSMTTAVSDAERARLAIAREHAGWSKEQVDEAVKASIGLESARKLVERMNAPSDAKGANPFWWAEGALPIIRQINETHQEYLAGLAHENAMILANSEAERIRLDLIQQYPSWTADMVDHAVSAALDVEATRQKADEIQDIVYRLTNWIDGSLDALLDDGFRGFFDEVVNGFTDMVADMAKAWIMSQMQNLFQDLLGGLLSPGGGGSSSKNASGAMPYIKARASGGPVDGGMPYLVGERGPEIIIPQASGHVYNNSETVSLLKAINSKQSSSLSSKVDGETTVNNVTQPVVVNVTINANDAGSFFGSERQMKQMIAQAVKDGLRR
jgi:TP901 family phage tail tape measure protein